MKIKTNRFIIFLLSLFSILIMITGCTKKEDYSYLVIKSGYYEENKVISTIEDYNNLSESIKEEINKNNFGIDEKYFEDNSLILGHISLGGDADIRINKIDKDGKRINIYYNILNNVGPAVITGKYIIVKTDKDINEINVIEE